MLQARPLTNMTKLTQRAFVMSHTDRTYYCMPRILPRNDDLMLQDTESNTGIKKVIREQTVGVNRCHRYSLHIPEATHTNTHRKVPTLHTIKHPLRGDLTAVIHGPALAILDMGVLIAIVALSTTPLGPTGGLVRNSSLQRRRRPGRARVWLLWKPSRPYLETFQRT